MTQSNGSNPAGADRNETAGNGPDAPATGAPDTSGSEAVAAKDTQSELSATEAPLNAKAEPAKEGRFFDAAKFKLLKDAAQSKIEKLEGELELVRAEAAEHKDRLLRTMAEMENLRRRTEREKSDMAKYGITKFARDVLTVADNFQRAIDTVPKDAIARDETLKNFAEGVELTERELLNVLERHGVKRIDPVGERFDPNIHQAMMEVENAEVPAGTVVLAYQPAYIIEDRVLRPAMVVVSKGGPKPVKPEAAEAKSEAPASEKAANEGMPKSDGPSDATPPAGDKPAG